MSAAKEAPPPPPADGAPAKKSKKLIIIIAGALVLVLIIVGAAVFMLKSKAPAEGDEDATHETTSKKEKSKKKDEKKAAPVYLKIDPYTINLKGDQGDQFLRIEMSAEFEDQHAADEAKGYMPKLRNQTMLLLSGKKANDLVSKEQKEKLATEIRDEINLVLGEPEKGEKTPKGPVKEVLFTDFVIQ